MKIITSMPELMRLAGELGRAKKSGDVEAIKIAKTKHDDYKDICLNHSVEMTLGMTFGELYADNIRKPIKDEYEVLSPPYRRRG